MPVKDDSPQCYKFGDFRLHVSNRELSRRGELIKLSRRQFDLLLALVESDGRTLTHAELLERVWADAERPGQTQLQKGVSAVRRALGESSDNSFFIETVPRVGYRFAAPVRRIIEDDSAAIRSIAAIDQPPDDFSPTGDAATNFRHSDKNSHHAPPSAPDSETGKPVRWFSVAVVLLCILALSFLILAWQNARRKQADALAFDNLKLQKFSAGGNVTEAAISPDGKTAAYATLEASGRQALWAREMNAANAVELVAPSEVEYQAIVFAPDGKSIYYGVTIDKTRDVLYKIPAAGGEPKPLTENIRSAVTFSPDGKRYAFARDRESVGRTLMTADAETGGDEREIVTVGDIHALLHPQWSPNGERFVFLKTQLADGERRWALADMTAEGRAIRFLIDPQRGEIRTFAWLADGSGIVAAVQSNDSTQTQIWRVAYPSGEMTRLTNDILSYQGVSLSADGKFILTTQTERTGDLWSVGVADFNNPQRLTASQNISGTFDVLPGGRILTEAVENGRRNLWLFDNGNLRPAITESGFNRHPNVAPDGKRVVFASRRTGSDEIWLANVDGGEARQLTDEKTFAAFPFFAPDGNSVYFQRHETNGYRLARVPAAGGAVSVVVKERIGDFDISPDGARLAYSFPNNAKRRWQVRIQNLATNGVEREFDIAPATFLRFTPDGKNLIYNVSDSYREGGNVWLQPLEGGAPRQIINAAPEKIYWADFAPESGKLYFTQGKTNSNIVLLARDK